jgi:threonine dehydrogenase-like Zn-dependent dehydrogenase
MLAVGAGGPMGQMHMQRALEVPGKPAKIVASERNPKRLDVLTEKFADEADRYGVEFIPFAFGDFPTVEMVNQALWQLTDGRGYDDIVVLAPSAAAAEAAMPLLAFGGMMVIFAGLPRGTLAEFDINQIVQRGARFTGTSGSSIEDLRAVLDLVESKQLATNRSVAAIAGLEGLADGLHAVHDGKVAGKIVIYPQITGLPLTMLENLDKRLPNVATKLTEKGVWTNAAEEELLREFLA